MPPNPKACGSCFILVWLLGWTAGVTVFDAFLFGALYHQLRTLTFATTEGVITRSEIRTERDGDGDSHRLNVAYTYTVAGQNHTGTRYSHSEMGTNSKAWHRIRNELPVGARVPVHYDPDTPADAVLHAGLTGFHLALIWFLTPFNVVMIGGWTFFARGLRPAFDPNDARSVRPTPSGWRVRLPDIGRAGCFGAIVLGITFAGTFVWGFGFGFNPPVWLAGSLYLATLGLAAFAALRHAVPWLEVNENERVVRVEPGAVEVPFAAVLAVTVRHEESTDSEGSTTHSYHLGLIRADTPAEAPPVHITTYRDPVPAEALAAWLRERIGLPDSD